MPPTNFLADLLLLPTVVGQGFNKTNSFMGERSGSVLDLRPKGRGFEPQRRHCVVVLEQDTFILA